MGKKPSKKETLIEGVKKMRRRFTRKADIDEAVKDWKDSDDDSIIAVLEAYDGNKKEFMKKLKKLKGQTDDKTLTTLGINADADIEQEDDGKKGKKGKKGQKSHDDAEVETEAEIEPDAIESESDQYSGLEDYADGEMEMQTTIPESMGCDAESHVVMDGNGFFACAKFVRVGSKAH